VHVCYECNKFTIVNTKKEKIYINNDALSDTLVYKLCKHEAKNIPIINLNAQLVI